MNRRGFFRGLLAAAGLAVASHYAPAALSTLAAPQRRYSMQVLMAAVVELALEAQTELLVYGSCRMATADEMLARAASMQVLMEAAGELTLEAQTMATADEMLARAAVIEREGSQLDVVGRTQALLDKGFDA